nr:MAG TPA: hypothetical protein [Caudoviricetes sp.]
MAFPLFHRPFPVRFAPINSFNDAKLPFIVTLYFMSFLHVVKKAHLVFDQIVILLPLLPDPLVALLDRFPGAQSSMALLCPERPHIAFLRGRWDKISTPIRKVTDQRLRVLYGLSNCPVAHPGADHQLLPTDCIFVPYWDIIRNIHFATSLLVKGQPLITHIIRYRHESIIWRGRKLLRSVTRCCLFAKFMMFYHYICGIYLLSLPVGVTAGLDPSLNCNLRPFVKIFLGKFSAFVKCNAANKIGSAVFAGAVNRQRITRDAHCFFSLAVSHIRISC